MFQDLRGEEAHVAWSTGDLGGRENFLIEKVLYPREWGELLRNPLPKSGDTRSLEKSARGQQVPQGLSRGNLGGSKAWTPDT